MNYLIDIKKAYLTDDDGVKERLKDYMNKVATALQCLIDLDDFCNNKVSKINTNSYTIHLLNRNMNQLILLDKNSYVNNTTLTSYLKFQMME